jgi:hypothetical protein
LHFHVTFCFKKHNKYRLVNLIMQIDVFTGETLKRGANKVVSFFTTLLKQRE